MVNSQNHYGLITLNVRVKQGKKIERPTQFKDRADLPVRMFIVTFSSLLPHPLQFSHQSAPQYITETLLENHEFHWHNQTFHQG
jgi:hypothetical protein